MRTPFLIFLCGLLLIIFSITLTLHSSKFGYDVRVRDMPILPLVIGLFVAGLCYSILIYLLGRNIKTNSNRKTGLEASKWLIGLFLFGLIARLILVASEPVLEDDYQRYLWDGAVTAQGHNPYLHAPKDIISGTGPKELQQIKDQSGLIIKRINHPDLRTIYPPGAQAVFAFSYWLKPFSLASWRSLIIVAEIISFLCIILLLRHFNFSPLLSAFYWLNPLVAKELINSAHMEAILMPFVLAGILLALKKKALMASTLISIAAAIKIWPLFLLPVIWRQMIGHRANLVVAVSLTALIGILSLLPIIEGGLDQSSGFVAYTEKWKTNSAFFPVWEQLVQFAGKIFGLEVNIIARLARFIIGLGIGGFALWLCWQHATDDSTLLKRFFVLTLLIFLLSPAQFPWYLVWVMPFVCFYPLPGLLILTPLMALYYWGFHLISHGETEIYKSLFVWIIWLPAWALLLTGLPQWGNSEECSSKTAVSS